MKNFFKIKINFANSKKEKHEKFKIECGDKFDSFLFYVMNSPTGIVEFHSDYFDIGAFIYDYRYEKDFDKISKWLKEYGEEI